MKRFAISVILVFCLTSYVYGFGSHGGHHDSQYFSGSNSGENGATVQDFDTTANGESVPLPVPEPSTMLLVASGLIGLGAYARRKFKK